MAKEETWNGLSWGDDVLVEGNLGTVMYVSDPFKCGNITTPDGTHPYGREVTIFFKEGE